MKGWGTRLPCAGCLYIQCFSCSSSMSIINKQPYYGVDVKSWLGQKQIFPNSDWHRNAYWTFLFLQLVCKFDLCLHNSFGENKEIVHFSMYIYPTTGHLMKISGLWGFVYSIYMYSMRKIVEVIFILDKIFSYVEIQIKECSSCLRWSSALTHLTVVEYLTF